MGFTDPDGIDHRLTATVDRVGSDQLDLLDQLDQPAVAHAVRGAHSADLMTMLLAVPSALPSVRELAWDWLATQGWPIAAAEDIQLAVHEAIANAIDHAYPPGAPGPVTVHAWVSADPLTRDRRVVVAVTDRGRWATHHPDTHPLHTRGYGLIVMSRCMAEMHIQRAAAGTTVILISVTTRASDRPA